MSTDPTHATPRALTARQEADLPIFRERWRAVGLSTAPIDEGDARRAVCALYCTANLREPIVFTLASPLACVIAREIVDRLATDAPGEAIFQVTDQVGVRFEELLKSMVWDRLLPQLGAHIGRQLRDPLRPGRLDWKIFQPHTQLRASLGDHVWQQIGHQLRHVLGEAVWTALQARLRAELVPQLGPLRTRIADQLLLDLGQDVARPTDFTGGMDAAWLSYYDFADHIGVALDPVMKARYEAFRNYALTAGWMFAFRRLAFVADRPAELAFDAQRRLHSATGMAVRFRDGWGLYAWHGRLIPAHLVEERHKITPDTIESMQNVELRRIALEIFGFENYLAVREARVIATDEVHGQPRRLLEVMVAGTPVRIVEVTNGSLEPDGSRRRFHLGAMRGDTPREVIAASYGIAAGIYREAVRS